MYTFENTCRIQLDAQSGGYTGGELTEVNPLIRKLDRLDESYKT